MPSKAVPGLVAGLLALALASPLTAQERRPPAPADSPEARTLLDRASALFRTGTALQNAGRQDSALTVYRSALASVRGIHRSSVDAAVVEAALLEKAGDVLRTLADLAGASAYYDSATARLETVRSRLNEADRLTVGTWLAPLYQRWILTALGRSPELGTEASAALALAIADRGRSRTLRDMRTSHVLGQGTSGIVLSYSAGMDMVRGGRNLIQSVDTLGLPTLFYQVTKDTLLVWSLADGRVDVHRAAIPSDTLNALAASLQSALEARAAPATWQPAARRLARLLLPPGLPDRAPAGELLIVPDGALARVPFAALPLPSHGLVGDRYAVRYMYGLGNLTAISTTTFDPAERLERGLIVGNPALPRTTPPGGATGFDPLPFAEAEALEIADRFTAEPLIGPDATETRFLAGLADASVVHVATHATAFDTEQTTDDSYLVLAADSAEDGILTIRELLKTSQPMQAELVVLSACRTGVGNIRAAEGTMGFQRAFLAMGANAVMVSLWKVQERQTKLLMDHFYDAWLSRDVGKPEALRTAQARIRETRGTEHPYYWAAFQIFQGTRSDRR